MSTIVGSIPWGLDSETGVLRHVLLGKLFPGRDNDQARNGGGDDLDATVFPFNCSTDVMSPGAMTPSPPSD
jgi:hypothetical protein